MDEVVEAMIGGGNLLLLFLIIYCGFRLFRYLYPGRYKGEYLFCAGYHKRKGIGLAAATAVFYGCAAVGWRMSPEDRYGHVLWVILMILFLISYLPEKIYTNGIEEISGFHTREEIARLEPEADHLYRVVFRKGKKKLYVKLRENAALPYMANTGR